MGSISLKKINKSFDSTEVLKNIDLEIKKFIVSHK